MEVKSIHVIISNVFNVEKIGTGQYKIHLNEEVGSGWNEVSLYKMSFPMSYQYYNVKQDVNCSIDAPKLNGLTPFVIKAGIYTVSSLGEHISKTIGEAVLKRTGISLPIDYFVASIKLNTLTKIQVDRSIAPSAMIKIPNSIANLLGFTEARPNIQKDDENTTFIVKRNSKKFTSNKVNTLDETNGLLITSIDWVVQQNSNLNVISSKAIDIENIVHIKPGERVSITNDHHLVWFKMYPSVKKSLIISFTDGENYFDITPGQTVFIQLLVRKK